MTYSGGDEDDKLLSGNGLARERGDVATIGTETSEEKEGNGKEGGRSKVLVEFLFDFSLFLRIKFIVDVDDIDLKPC